jgi:signal transduction histidine kinase
MFKKFSRATNAKNMYTDGSGLGLFIIKEIIDGHHGKVAERVN